MVQNLCVPSQQGVSCGDRSGDFSLVVLSLDGADEIQCLYILVLIV